MFSLSCSKMLLCRSSKLSSVTLFAFSSSSSSSESLSPQYENETNGNSINDLTEYPINNCDASNNNDLNSFTFGEKVINLSLNDNLANEIDDFIVKLNDTQSEIKQMQTSIDNSFKLLAEIRSCIDCGLASVS